MKIINIILEYKWISDNIHYCIVGYKCQKTNTYFGYMIEIYTHRFLKFTTNVLYNEENNPLLNIRREEMKLCYIHN